MSSFTGAQAAPLPAQVLALQEVHEYPAISLLLSTTPGAALTPSDVRRLNVLVASAVARVRAELPSSACDPVLHRLADALEEAHRGSTSRGLAIYASPTHTQVVRLPVGVRERAVVDPSFATRDLIRALHRTPRHLVLALNAGQARLFDAAGEALLPALSSAFPMHAGPRTPARGRGRGDRPARAGEFLDFYREVDDALGAYARLHPAPLILVGDDRATATFSRISVNCARLAGTVRGNLITAAPAELAARIRATLTAYLHRRQDEALALVERRAAAGRVAAGMPAAWLAARTENPEMLVVDETLYYPARLLDDGDTLIPAEDVEHPDVFDDAVDDLIELVLVRGGWIAFTEPGALDRHQGVALTTRR